jgi:hypothetical protein
VEPSSYLDDFIMRNIAGGKTPKVQSSLDPAAMLTAAFSQTPNYLGS